MANEDSIEQMIYDETEKRLGIMESKDYVFPPKIGKVDVVAIIASCAVSLVLIILCMTGVIA